MWPKQAGRPEGGDREAWASVPAPTWTPAGPGPMTLICLASQTPQLFPVSSPLDTQSQSRGGVREVRIFLQECVYFFKKASKPGKAWDKPS